MNNPLPLAALAAALALGSATAAAQKPAVDCTTASNDIATLQHEKKATQERKLKGVFSIMPIGIAFNALESATESKKEMQIDDYNKKLDERIAEIKSACNM